MLKKPYIIEVREVLRLCRLSLSPFDPKTKPGCRLPEQRSGEAQEEKESKGPEHRQRRGMKVSALGPLPATL